MSSYPELLCLFVFHCFLPRPLSPSNPLLHFNTSPDPGRPWTPQPRIVEENLTYAELDLMKPIPEAKASRNGTVYAQILFGEQQLWKETFLVSSFVNIFFPIYRLFFLVFFFKWQNAAHLKWLYIEFDTNFDFTFWQRRSARNANMNATWCHSCHLLPVWPYLATQHLCAVCSHVPLCNLLLTTTKRRVWF